MSKAAERSSKVSAVTLLLSMLSTIVIVYLEKSRFDGVKSFTVNTVFVATASITIVCS